MQCLCSAMEKDIVGIKPDKGISEKRKPSAKVKKSPPKTLTKGKPFSAPSSKPGKVSKPGASRASRKSGR